MGGLIGVEGRVRDDDHGGMKHPTLSRRRTAGLLLGLGLAMLLAGGCAAMFNGARQTHRASSVVSYLYPGQTDPLPPTSIPTLRLPLRVGIAFVPAEGATGRGINYGGPGGGLSEAQKTALMEKIAAEFRAFPFVQSIEVVPSTYLRAGGGFDNLNQVRALLSLDVIALVAYDQVQFTNENFLSLAYWTIVGAYVVTGNKNDTQTLMETAVYDIPSRHLLFRAPGSSEVKALSAGVYVQENLRADSAKGFDQATVELIANLKQQLTSFRERAKQAPDTVARIEHRPGYTGGGALGGEFVAVLAAWAVAMGVRKKFFGSHRP